MSARQVSSLSDTVTEFAPPLQAGVACFCLRVEADPAALSRVIEHFALLNVVPDLVRARRCADGSMVVDIKVRGLCDDRVSVIAHKLRSVVVVHSVGVEVFAVGTDLESYQLAKLT